MLVSIVANFYNSARFIPKLLESVFNQTYKDWELVCVVDSSPGNDAEVIDSCARRYGVRDKVRIIVNKERLGISRSKKVGIDNARGEYITFSDGDDFFDYRALEVLAAPALKHNVDLVNMNYCRYYAPLRKRVDICVPFREEVYERVMLKEEFFDRCFINFFGPSFISFTYWGKLYRASLLKDLKFDYPSRDDVVAEDKWFNMEVFQHVKSAYFVRFVGYYWRWGGISSFRVDKSWTHRLDLDKHLQMLPLQLKLIDKYDYQKALPPLVNSTLRVMFQDIGCMASWSPKSAKARDIKAYIAKCLESPAIEALLAHRRFVALEYQTLIDAVAHDDVETVYKLMHDEYRRTWKTRWSKNAFNFLFYHFR